MIVCLIWIGVKLSMPPLYWIILGMAFLYRILEALEDD